MAELVQNRQFFRVNNFTCDFCFAKFFLNIKRIYSFLSVPDAFASIVINDEIGVFTVKLNRVFSLSLYILRPTVCYKIKQFFSLNNRNSCHKLMVYF